MWRVWRSLCAGMASAGRPRERAWGPRGADQRQPAKVPGTVTPARWPDRCTYGKPHASACQTPSHGVPGRADAVAEACLAEGRAPYIANARVQHPGRRGPPSFKGMILKLLVRIPCARETCASYGWTSISIRRQGTGTSTSVAMISRLGTGARRSARTTWISRTTVPTSSRC